MKNEPMIIARIFNRIINEIGAIKGVEFFSEEEYKQFEEKVKKIIKHELDIWS